MTSTFWASSTESKTYEPSEGKVYTRGPAGRSGEVEACGLAAAGGGGVGVDAGDFCTDVFVFGMCGAAASPASAAPTAGAETPNIRVLGESHGWIVLRVRGSCRAMTM
jgi:hypothetical protein